MRASSGGWVAKSIIARPPAIFSVASSGSPEKMRFTLGLTGLWDLFEGRIYSASQMPRGKPFPDLFLHAAAQFGVTPETAIVIEDSPHGVRAGVAAGMTRSGRIRSLSFTFR